MWLFLCLGSASSLWISKTFSFLLIFITLIMMNKGVFYPYWCPLMLFVFGIYHKFEELLSNYPSMSFVFCSLFLLFLYSNYKTVDFLKLSNCPYIICSNYFHTLSFCVFSSVCSTDYVFSCIKIANEGIDVIFQAELFISNISIWFFLVIFLLRLLVDSCILSNFYIRAFNSLIILYSLCDTSNIWM